MISFVPDSRWLWNEDHQLALHTRRFDVPALKDAAAEALEVGHWRVQLHRIPGLNRGENKWFLASSLGGQKLVMVKLPDPVVTPRVVTASEVARMEFVRNELGWSVDAEGPVGSEYVVMDMTGREELPIFEWKMIESGLEGRAKLLEGAMGVCEKLLKASEMFKGVGYGSLYFTKDAEKLGFQKIFELKGGKSPGKFCLGPLTDKHYWADGSEYIDRGPCKSSTYCIPRSPEINMDIKGSLHKRTSPPLPMPQSPTSSTAETPAQKPNPSFSTLAMTSSTPPLKPSPSSAASAPPLPTSFTPPSPHQHYGTPT